MSLNNLNPAEPKPYDAAGRQHRFNEQPRPRGRAFLIVAVLVCVFVGLLGIVLWSRAQARATLENDTRENAIPTVSVVHPKRTPSQVEIELPGNLNAFEEAPIYARISGYLTNWLTDIGTHVTEGQLLAEIDSPEVDQELIQSRAALAQAKANLEIARTTAVRWQDMLKSDAVAKQDTDEKVATWHAREADVQAAEANVQRLSELDRFKKLVAPFSGIITVRNVDVGTLITAGSSREIFRLARVDPLRVYVSLPQAYSQAVKPGDEATLLLSEMPGEKFTGKVVRTSGAIDPASRTLLTEVQVPNHDRRLFSGAHAMVRLSLHSPGTPVVLPVNTLLFRNDQGMQAGVVDSNGIVRLANLTVGRDFGNSVEIVAGLSESDDVILNPSDSLEPGMQVRVAKPAKEPRVAGEPKPKPEPAPRP